MPWAAMASVDDPQHREDTPIDDVASGATTHYSQHQQPPLLQPGPAQHSASAPYDQYRYTRGFNSPSAALPAVSNPVGSPKVLPLPVVRAQGAMQDSGQGFDTTGQQPPPGIKLRVTATWWEDEGSLCFQVEARGICVTRRKDNNMINGTKLLNVAGILRRRRDGILKGEKVRQVVKIGPMHLQGVWIPYDRALGFANQEKITELLYPLFVHNIGPLLDHPTNQGRAQVMAEVERIMQEHNQMRTPPALPSMSHSHYLMARDPSPQTSLPSHSTMAQSLLDRAHTLPTPGSGQAGGDEPSSSYQGLKPRSPGGTWKWSEKRIRKRPRPPVDGSRPPSDSDGEGWAEDDGQASDVSYRESKKLPELLFACPFYKFSPYKYSACSGYKLKRFADVKRHLHQRHTLKGHFYCPNCWEQWKGRREWEEHIQSNNCQAIPRPEDLLEEENSLKKMPRLLNDLGKWYWVWKELFPGHGKPESPFIRDGLAEAKDLIRRDAETTLSSAFPQILSRHNISLDPDATPQLTTAILRVIFDDIPVTSRRISSSAGCQTAVTDDRLKDFPTKVHQSSVSTPDTMLRLLLMENPVEVDASLLASTSTVQSMPPTETLQQAQGFKPQLKSPNVFDTHLSVVEDELWEGKNSDTESSSASDYSEGTPCLDKGHPFLRAKSDIVKNALTAFHTRKLRYIDGNKEAVSGNDCTNSSHTVCAASSMRGGDNWSGGKGNKNKRKSRSAEGYDQNDGREEENDENNPTKRKRLTKQSTMREILLACPFAKKNPIKYRGCHGYVLKRIQDVKQHLRREHQLPIYCSRCQEIFKTEQDRDDHHRADERCSIRHGIRHEGLTKSQHEQLSVRVSVKMTLEEQWYTIFDILFPGHLPRPESPYINNDLSVDLESFLALMRSEGPSIILSALQTHGIELSTIRNEERDLDTLLQNVIREGLQDIAQRWILSLTESDTSATQETQRDATTASTAPHTQNGSRPPSASSTARMETGRCDQGRTGGDEALLNQEIHDGGTIEYTELAPYQPMGEGTSGWEDMTRREAFHLFDGTQSNFSPEMHGYVSENNHEQPQFNLAGALDDDNILQELTQPEFQIGFP